MAAGRADAKQANLCQKPATHQVNRSSSARLLVPVRITLLSAPNHH
jgi:hypothetical protein